MTIMKIKRTIIILLSLSILVILLYIFLNNEKKVIGMVEVESTIELQNFLDNKKTAIIYFGRPTCPECQEILPHLEGFVEKNELYLSYYNTDNRRSDETFSETLDIYGVFNVPYIVKVSKGEIVYSNPVNIDNLDEVYNIIKN